MNFSPKPSPPSPLVYSSYGWSRFKRMCNGRLLVLFVLLGGLTWWAKGGLKQELEVVKIGVSEFGLRGQHFEVEATKNLQFFPAANAKIHVCRKCLSVERS